jgi:hypothetical protein
MKFEQRFPAAKTTDKLEFEYSYITKDSKLGQCFVCGAFTRWIDIKFQKHVCSEECCTGAWRDFNENNSKVFRHEKFEVFKQAAETELAIASMSKPAWKDILIVVHDQLSYMKDCIESVRANTRDFTLYIWDNASRQDMVDYLDGLQREHASLPNPDWDIEVVRAPKNEGFIEPNNALAAMGTGDYIIPLNSDTKVFEHWDTAMIGWMQQNPDVAEVGYWGGHLGPDGRGFGGDNGYDVDYIPGWCFAISRETYKQFGLFNQTDLTFAYCEDADLSLRLKEAGKQIYALHVPLVYHFQNKTINVVEKEGEVDVRATFAHNHEYIEKRWHNYLEKDRVLARRAKEGQNVGQTQ